VTRDAPPPHTKNKKYFAPKPQQNAAFPQLDGAPRVTAAQLLAFL
jgi:hypothetical protein